MLYIAIVFAPLIGFLFAGAVNKRMGDTVPMLVTTGLLFLSAILSWVALVRVGFGHQPSDIRMGTWLDVGNFQANWSLKIDTLTAVMLVVICLLYTSPSPRDQRGSRMPSSA